MALNDVYVLRTVKNHPHRANIGRQEKLLWLLSFFNTKSVTERTLPWGTPISWSNSPDRQAPKRTENYLFFKKPLIKQRSLPRRTASWRSFMIPYFHVQSYACSRSKNTATACWRWIKASLIKDSKRTRWSAVLRCLRKPHWRGVMSLFLYKNQTSLLLIMRFITLHKQLVSAVGR